MKIDHLLLYVSNLNETADFYEKLGFNIRERNDSYLVVGVDDFELHCYDQAKVHFKQDADRLKGAGVFIYLLVDDVDKKYSELIAKGLKPSGKPTDWDWGNREFVIKDPNNYKIVVYKKLIRAQG